MMRILLTGLFLSSLVAASFAPAHAQDARPDVPQGAVERAEDRPDGGASDFHIIHGPGALLRFPAQLVHALGAALAGLLNGLPRLLRSSAHGYGRLGDVVLSGDNDLEALRHFWPSAV